MEKQHDSSAELVEVQVMDQELAERSKPNAGLKEVCEPILRAFERDDTGMAELIGQWWDSYFIWDRNKQAWFCYDIFNPKIPNARRWKCDDYPLRDCIKCAVTERVEDLLEPFNYLEEDDENPNAALLKKTKEKWAAFHKSKALKTNGLSGVITACKQLFAQQDAKFDTNPHLLGFENGVVDLVACVFRPYQFSDRMTMSTR